MMHISKKLIATTSFAFAFLLLNCSRVLFADGPAIPEKIDFNRDIRPILSDTCFKCHGPNADDREADLRFDQKDSVFEDRGGYASVVPGDLENSELYQRLITDDKDSLMPPPDSHRTLTKNQITLFKKWIEQGAKWQGHWSFESLQRPKVPEVKDASWAKNPIDRFILARLESEGLAPNADADRRDLIRRVTLDLTGLPPTIEEVEAFVADESPDAYEKIVDLLLTSPRYGEHMARYWLDASRYGDTHGLHLDNYREFWLYRDWIINAFNENKSYKQFAIEQLAGDLLENPTQDQLIATGFNRAHVTTAEGGSIKDEVYVRNVVDRVSTTGIVFMGLTTGCAVCHDHKYDPISQKDFYSLFAFFNSLDADPMDGNKKAHPPVIDVPSVEQQAQVEKTEAEIAALNKQIEDQVASYKYQEPVEADLNKKSAPIETVWIEDNVPAGAQPDGDWEWTDKSNGGVKPFSGERASTRTASGLSQHFFTDAGDKITIGKADKLFAYVYLDPRNPPKQIMLQWNNGSWGHRAYWGENKIDWGSNGKTDRLRIGDLPETGKWVRLEVPATKVGLNAGSKVNGWAFTQFDGTVHWDKAGVVTDAANSKRSHSFKEWLTHYRKAKGKGLEKPIAELLKKKPEELNEKQNKKLLNHFIQNELAATRETFKPLTDKLKSLNDNLSAVKNEIPTSLISKETPEPREAFILIRGEYDRKGDKVERATPKSLPPFPADAPLNRLGFARWLTDESHPLTARVTVNRYWQQMFGTGIVKTSGDFGAQGDVPSHPELLDWLAADFMENDWDIKRIMKTIVTSSAYRQSSVVTEEKYKLDPSNRLLARGPRFRLDAEMVRDQALAVSGLLNDIVGGPSVKPPQPDGLWFVVGYSGSNTVRFAKDSGSEKVHRRSLYTFWKRTSPPPQMNIMDAPSREECTVRRERTNTPMQALMLMNDPQYVEAARHLGQRAIDQGGETFESKASFAFQLATARPPRKDEVELLRMIFNTNLAIYQADAEAARKLIAIGEKPAAEKYDPAQLAAWTMVSNLILNLDEVITKN